MKTLEQLKLKYSFLPRPTQITAKSVFKDGRGEIQNFLTNVTVDVVRITSRPNSIRANHFHKISSHFCIVADGQIEYYERPAGAKTKPTRYIFNKGDVFYTGPVVEHAMFFPVETSFICLSTGARTQKEYEEDLVRLDFDLIEEYENM